MIHKCRKCGCDLHPTINWYNSMEKKSDYLCIPCTKKRNENNHLKNRTERIVYKKERYWKLRINILTQLGGKCILCGSQNLNFITLHHSVPMDHNCQPYHYMKYIDLIYPLCWDCHDKIHEINGWLRIKDIYYKDIW